VALARRILDLSDDAEADPMVVLRLADTSLTKESPVALIRKAYLKLSLSIHPDRCKFTEATKSFQILVTAFEHATAPELPAEPAASGAKKKKQSSTAISRSNEGCFTTRVECPRCKQEWGTPIEGNPDYFYTVMMQGMKSFTCATCLCTFGAMSAIHRCPGCRQPFEYTPADFHRKVSCGSPACNARFGFHLHYMSDRVLRDLRDELKAKRDQRIKAVESKKRRAASARKRRRGAEEETDERAEDEAFALGLSDECPRCGMSFLEIGDTEAQCQHLLQCTDVDAIKAHKKRKRKRKLEAEANEKRQEQQEDAESFATWQLLGSKQQALYLLTEDQLRQQCIEQGAPIAKTADGSEGGGGGEGEGASKEDLIASLVQFASFDNTPGGPSTQSGALMITDGSDGRRAQRKRKRVLLSAESLPDSRTLQGMDLMALRCICISHGFMPQGMTRSQVLEEIEAELHMPEHKQALLLLEDSSVSRAVQPPAGQGKSAATALTVSDGDSDYDPDE